MESKRSIIIAGRDFAPTIHANAIPAIVGLTGISLNLVDFYSSLQSEALLYANLLALSSVCWFAVKITSAVITFVRGIFSGDTEAYLNAKRGYELAKQEFQDEVRKLDRLEADLGEARSSKSLERLRELGKIDE